MRGDPPPPQEKVAGTVSTVAGTVSVIGDPLLVK